MATMRAMLGETLMPGPQPRHKCLPEGVSAPYVKCEPFSTNC